MSIITIESNTDQQTNLLLHYSEENKLPFQLQAHRILTDDDVLFGFGRKATDAEMTEYLLSTEENNEDEYISIEALRKAYPNP